MCEQCEQFNGTVKLQSAAHLKELNAALQTDGLAMGVLRIVAGGLDWDDIMYCLLECSGCGQQFQLSCDTYHGNGDFKPVKTKANR